MNLLLSTASLALCLSATAADVDPNALTEERQVYLAFVSHSSTPSTHVTLLRPMPAGHVSGPLDTFKWNADFVRAHPEALKTDRDKKLLEEQKPLIEDKDGMVGDFLRKAGAEHLLDEQLRKLLGSHTNTVVFGESGEKIYRTDRLKHPEGPEDIVELSRVGLNASTNRALLYIRYYGGDLSGGSILYIFEKRDGVWKVLKTFTISIS
jgi:hypothetical protein